MIFWFPVIQRCFIYIFFLNLYNKHLSIKEIIKSLSNTFFDTLKLVEEWNNKFLDWFVRNCKYFFIRRMNEVNDGLDLKTWTKLITLLISKFERFENIFVIFE